MRSYGKELPNNATILFGVAQEAGNFAWPPGESDWTRNTTMKPPTQYLRLKRTGNEFSGFISADGATWENIGTDVTVITAPGVIGLGVAGTTLTVFKDFKAYVPRPVLDTPTVSGGNVTIKWTGAGTLQQSTDLKAWSNVAGNPPSPYQVALPAGAGQTFYRVIP